MPPSLADPLPASSLISATAWIQGAMLGSVATMIAVVCVACLGMLMFLGRLPIRRGIMVVLGCFLLFGASIIAAGMRTALSSGEGVPVAPMVIAAPLPPPLPKPSPRSPTFDPYAGAAVPTTR